MEYIDIELNDLPKQENNSNRIDSSVSISTWYATILFGQMLSMHLFGVWTFYIH